MLYETLSQPLVILCIAVVGLLAGLFVDVANILDSFCNKNKVVKHILYFLCTILSASLLFYTNLKINYGKARLYVLVIFFLAYIIERITIGKLWTKLIEKCYNVSERRKQRRLKENERREESKTN